MSANHEFHRLTKLAGEGVDRRRETARDRSIPTAQRRADIIVGRRRYCRRALGVLAVVGLFIAATPGRMQQIDPQSTRRPELERGLGQLLVALGAEPAKCHRSLLTVPLGHALCGELSKEPKRNWAALREKLERQMKIVADTELAAKGWKVTKAFSRREFTSHGVRVVAAIRHKSGQLALVYPPMGTACLSAEAREGAVDSELARPEGFELPVAVATVLPEYPEAARIERLGASVLLGYRIESTGEVSEVCLALTDDRSPGQAMVQAAIEALRDTRYRPGKIDGRPVAVVASTVSTFELNPMPPR